MAESRPIRVCFILSPAAALGVHHRDWTYFRDHGCQVFGISGHGLEHHATARRMGMETHVVPIERFPHPFKDALSLIRMWWVLLWHRFDVIHVSTPKASFIGTLAARLSGQRRVLYLVRGRPYEHMTGLRRNVMGACEWLTCHLAQCVVPVSREMGEALVTEGLCSRRKIRLQGAGSSRGVDWSVFSPTEENTRAGREIRAEFGVAPNDLLVLCVGWLRREKGTNELIHAFRSLAEQVPSLHLLLLGNYEPHDPLEPGVVHTIENHGRIHRLAWREQVAPVYAAADIFVFPSHREGLPRAILEASAMGMPVVASDIMGCREAMLDGVTGLLTPLGDAEALSDTLNRLIGDPALRRELGRNGRQRVEKEFRADAVFESMLAHFAEVASG